MVGYCGASTEGQQRAFLWKNGVISPVAPGGLRGWTRSQATGINCRGDIALTFYALENEFWVPQAAVLSGGVLTPVTDRYHYSQSAKISNSVLIGEFTPRDQRNLWFSNPYNSFDPFSMRRTATGWSNFKDLLPSAPSFLNTANANGVNAYGQIVGVNFPQGNFREFAFEQAYSWSGTNATTIPGGWVAKAVNDSGQIVGYKGSPVNSGIVGRI